MHFVFFQLSKKYGSVFTVYFGTNKVVVLAGYKAVKEALVNYAEEFGDRDMFPASYDISRGHGMTFLYKTLYICLHISTKTNTRHEYLKHKENPKSHCICLF